MDTNYEGNLSPTLLAEYGLTEQPSLRDAIGIVQLKHANIIPDCSSISNSQMYARFVAYEKDVLREMRASRKRVESVNVDDILCCDVKERASITCRHCKSSNVTYVLRQTRSADEAMTCIVTCHNCTKCFTL